MESSNQETRNKTNPRYLTLEKETIKKTTVKNEIRKLIETLKRKYIKRNRQKSQSYKEAHEKKKYRIFFLRFFLSLEFLQLLDLQKKKIKTVKSKQGRNIAHETSVIYPRVLKCVKTANLRL